MASNAAVVPTHKSDAAAVDRARALGWPALRPDIPDLLEWCRDSNWPVARPLGELLGSLGPLIADDLRVVLRSQDPTAIYHVISCVVAAMPVAGVTALKDDLDRLANRPDPGQVQEDVPEVAASQLQRIAEPPFSRGG